MCALRHSSSEQLLSGPRLLGRIVALRLSEGRVHWRCTCQIDAIDEVGRKSAFPGTAMRNPRNAWRCITYIVRRTQLYLDEDLWGTLHERARSQGTTVSELVRRAVRERYLGNHGQRMKAFVGIRGKGSQTPDAVELVRSLRRGDRLDRLTAK